MVGGGGGGGAGEGASGGRVPPNPQDFKALLIISIISIIWDI